ncbi:SpoIIE family protein phosphatase [Nocardioides sp.]|uniref:SpoIIE family protein phosphatase n=1 Tax=Nocardioides sp. TaxID=35761 RepID=UPI00286B878A|nr:SpoIIE family protein phosphatase [Nocardioides sp.]
MSSWTTRGVVAPALAVAFLATALVIDFVADVQLTAAYATAGVIASISCRPGRTAAVAWLSLTAAFVSGAWHDTLGDTGWVIRLVSCLVASVASVAAAYLADQYRRRMQHTTRLAQDLLDALAVELTGARTETEVADGFLGKAAGRLGAASAMIFVVEEDVLRSVSWLGRGGPQADAYTEIPLAADLPGAVAARSGLPQHYSDRAAILDAFPALAGYYEEERSLHVLPLVDGDASIGLLALTFPPGVVETAEERGLLVSLAGALTAALTRARSLAQTDAEVQRTAILSEASRTLSHSLDWDETLEEVHRLLVPRMADWCSLHLLRNGVLETAAVWHSDPDTSAWAQGMRDVFPVDMTSPTGAPAVVRTGQPELYAFIPEELIEAAAVNEEHATLLKRLGLVSAAVAPLRSGDKVIGALSLAYAESGRHYGPEDTELLVDLAARIASALSNADSFTRQSQRLTEVMKVAAAAQQAILAPPPPRVGPFALSARYVSAVEEAQIGGDLYEVVALPDRVRVLIGDVRGKGLGAVRTATIVLGGFRSVAVLDIPVDEVARQLDKHVQVYLHDEEDFVTAALMDIHHDGRFSLVLCGHPPPVLARDSAWRVLDATPTVPLGLGSSPKASHGCMVPGDRLILFTDGLLEARQPDGAFIDPEPLWAMVASQPFPHLLDSLLDALRYWTGERLRDDLAMLSIEFQQPDADRVAPEGAATSRIARVLPPDGASVGLARRLVRSLLRETSMETATDDAELVVSELVTNALVHAGGEIHLTLALDGSGLRVEVADDSAHPPVRRDYSTSSGTGRGLHLIESLVTRWSTFRLGRGKVVWVEMEDPRGLPFAGARAPFPVPEPAAEDVALVELRNVPLLMHAAWQEHASALLREYLLVQLDDDPTILERHAQASDAMNLLHEQVPVPDLGADPDAVMSSALEPHVSIASMTLRVPGRSVAHFAVLDELVRDALQLAASLQLLVPPTQPEVRAMSHWLCREVVQQSGTGRAPQAWSSPEPQQVSVPGASQIRVEGWDSCEVSDSPQALLATNEASLIVAVSRTALATLGYDQEGDLVGRPVTCIVPSRYRQAHIAGTTLHVINGRDPLLGKAITVPVVLADGQEAMRELTVVSRSLANGRRLFVAEFTALPDES